MRFPFHFTRVKPAATGKVTLGSETTPPTTPPLSSMDNLFAGKFTSPSGFPVQRLAIGYKYTGAGPAIDLPVQVWIWDDSTTAWYLLSSGTLTHPSASGQGTVTKVASLAGSDMPAVGAGLGSAQGVGSLTVFVFVSDPGAAPNGTYDFVVAPDLASF